MNYTWLNGVVFPILERIGKLSEYFETVVPYLAGICGMMALGVTCFKILLQAADARAEFIKLFYTFIIYTFMLWAFPLAMNGILLFCTDLGYEAAFYGGTTNLVSDPSVPSATPSGFYQWVADQAGDGALFSTTSEKDDAGEVKSRMNMNIIDKKTGYMDLNASFKFILLYIRLRWDCMPKITFGLSVGGISGALILNFIVNAIAVILSFCVYCFILISYVMCLFDFSALKGFGILMVPLSLWEGTKSYTSALLGSIGKIMIKLIVVSAISFLAFSCIIDQLYDLYKMHMEIENNSGVVDFALKEAKGSWTEVINCLSTIFQSIFLYMLTKQTGAIAGFLSGGDPRLSFGEFAQAAREVSNSTRIGKSGGKAMGNAGANMIGGMKNTMAAGVAGFATGGVKGMAGAMAKQGGQNLSNLARSAVGAIPKIARGAADLANNGMGMSGAVSSEGISGFVGGAGGGGSEAPSEGGGNAPSKAEGGSAAEAKAQPQGGGGDSKENGNDGAKAGTSSSSGEKTAGSSSNIGGGSSSGSIGSSGGGPSGSNGPSSAKAGERRSADGNTGIYGNADAGKNNAENNLIRAANRNSTSGDAMKRELGAVQGAAGNFLRNYNKARQSQGVMKSVGSAMASSLKSSAPVQAFKSARASIGAFRDAKGQGGMARLQAAARAGIQNPTDGFIRAANHEQGMIRDFKGKGKDGKDLHSTVQTRFLGKGGESYAQYDSNGKEMPGTRMNAVMQDTLKHGAPLSEYATGPEGSQANVAPTEDDAVSNAREATQMAMQNA